MNKDFETRGGRGGPTSGKDFLIIISPWASWHDVRSLRPHLCIPFLPSEVPLAERRDGMYSVFPQVLWRPLCVLKILLSSSFLWKNSVWYLPPPIKLLVFKLCPFLSSAVHDSCLDIPLCAWPFISRTENHIKHAWVLSVEFWIQGFNLTNYPLSHVCWLMFTSFPLN